MENKSFKMEWISDIDSKGNILHDLIYKDSIVGSAFEIIGEKKFWWTMQFPIFDIMGFGNTGDENNIVDEIMSKYFGLNQVPSLKEAKDCCYKTAQEVLTKYGKAQS